jgi:hypothetical protein
MGMGEYKHQVVEPIHCKDEVPLTEKKKLKMSRFWKNLTSGHTNFEILYLQLIAGAH